MVTRRVPESVDELLRHDHYEPDELSDLLEMDVNLIEQEAFRGTLKAYIIDHHIVSIRREDVLQWLAERG